MKKLALLLIFTALLCCACNSESPSPEDSAPTEVSTEQLALFSRYTVIRPDLTDDAVTNAAIKLRDELGLTINTDWVKRGDPVPEDGIEVLVGQTNRSASAEALAELSGYRGNYANDFIIRIGGGKVVITGGSPSAVSEGTDYFVENVLPTVDEKMLSEGFEYISRREYAVETINGVSIGDFAIYLPKNASEELKTIAAEMHDRLFEDSGFDIPVLDREGNTKAGIWLCVSDYGEGKKALDELAAYRENCINDWMFRVKDGTIVAVGFDDIGMKAALEKLIDCAEGLLGGKNNNDYIYRKDYKMITLASKSIKDYSILIEPDATFDIRSAANKIQAKIREVAGFELPIVTEPAENNIQITISGDMQTGALGFDGSDLVVSGGHYMSAAKAADELVALMKEDSDTNLKSDFALTKTYDFSTVPLVCDRYPEMQLVWNDEFESTDGTYDHNKWLQRAQMGATDMYNSKTERNVKVEDGNLVMRSWKEEDTSISDGKPYSTNMSMTTRDSCNYCYGYLEMKAKVPFGKGCWPSFWMVQREDMRNEGVNWMSEIDIFEVFGSKNALVPNIHKWYNNTANNYHVQLDGTRKTAYKFENYENLSDEYHIYGFYWDEEKMVFSVDGEDYCTIDITPETGDFGQYKGMDGFHTPNYIILNNFLFTPEASWIPDGAMVDDNVKYPVTYTVDYIRLYQGDNGVMYSPILGESMTDK